MKKICLISLCFMFLAAGAGETMKVCLNDRQQLALRREWSKTEDLVLFCGLGGNRQFNFSTAHLVPVKTSDEEVLIKRKAPMRFHWCGDSTGVFYVFPDPAKWSVDILCGNHGYCGSKVTMPGHGYTAADVGKKVDKNHWIAKVNGPDELVILPGIAKKNLPRATKVVPFANFPASRILKRSFLLDGKTLPAGKIMEGKEVAVIEKIGICPFPALAAAGFKQEKVEKFLAIYDIGYYFYPNGACRVETRIFYPEDICLSEANPMQDGDMELFQHDTYEKYIPKLKAVPANSVQKPVQIYVVKGNKRIADSRGYDFAAVQDLTELRRPRSVSPRFEFTVKGGFVDPVNQPDRFIEFLGKRVQDKKVRKIGNVLGLDPEFGLCRPEERSKNGKSFVLAAWHKTYPSVFARPGKNFIKKGTKFLCVGYRCYFNPEKIGDATALYVIPHKDHKKVYADFHKGVRNYELPFKANAKVKILESSPGVTLNGNKVSVAGKYGYIVVKVSGR